MISQKRILCWLSLVAITLVLVACAGGATPAASNANVSGEPVSATVSFKNDVMPLLQSRCFTCHGGQQTNRGLDLATYDSLMAGSQNGPVVTAGDAANSLIIQLVASGMMPKSGAKLTPAEVQMLTDWVNAGAKDN